MTEYTIDMIGGEKVVRGSDGSILPISILDKHRLCSNREQIGRRWWDDKCGDWSYEITEVGINVNVTGFIGE